MLSSDRLRFLEIYINRYYKYVSLQQSCKPGTITAPILHKKKQREICPSQTAGIQETSLLLRVSCHYYNTTLLLTPDVWLFHTPSSWVTPARRPTIYLNSHAIDRERRADPTG